MNISLHQLRLLQAVAREGGVSRAARALHLAQPTLSAQLRQMSDNVGLPLLERVGRGVRLTEAGQKMVIGAEQIAQTLEWMEDEMAGLRGERAGRLRLAVVSTAEAFIPRLLGVFRQAHPEMEASLVVSNRNTVLQRLHEHADDFYIMTRPPEGLALSVTPFMPNPLVVIAPTAHRLCRCASKGLWPVSALAEEEFVLREVGSGTRQAAEVFLSAHGVHSLSRLELGSNEAVRQAVAAGLGLSVLSAHALGEDRTARDIAVLPVEGTPLSAQWYVVYWSSQRLMPIARAFLQFLLKAGPSLHEDTHTKLQERFSGKTKPASML